MSDQANAIVDALLAYDAARHARKVAEEIPADTFRLLPSISAETAKTVIIEKVNEAMMAHIANLRALASGEEIPPPDEG